jgi:hypothetical protein
VIHVNTNGDSSENPGDVERRSAIAERRIGRAAGSVLGMRDGDGVPKMIAGPSCSCEWQGSRAKRLA